MVVILFKNWHVGLKRVSALLAGILTTALFFPIQPVLSAADVQDYDIPLRELKQIVKKEGSIKPKTSGTKKIVRPQAQSDDSATWATLGSVRLIDDGIRMDIDGLNQKIILLLEPRNKKVVLQFVGVRYPTGAINIPLKKFGFERARLGRHTDGIWVVLDSSDSRLPVFDLIRDDGGITLKMAGRGQTGEARDLTNQSVVLAKEVLMSAHTHVVPPGIHSEPAGSVSAHQALKVSSPAAADIPEPPSLNDEIKSVQISHTPFSTVVPGKRAVLRAVISSVNEIVDARCVVQTENADKPIMVSMTKVAGSIYTYEAMLPPPPTGSRSLNYKIIARDSRDNEARSNDFSVPVTSSPVVPVWQQ